MEVFLISAANPFLLMDSTVTMHIMQHMHSALGSGLMGPVLFPTPGVCPCSENHGFSNKLVHPPEFSLHWAHPQVTFPGPLQAPLASSLICILS